MARSIKMEVLSNDRPSYAVIESSLVALNEAHVCNIRKSVTTGVRTKEIIDDPSEGPPATAW
jgi:hypothetical protein